MKKKSDFQVQVMNRRYDITGQEILRIGKHYLISRLSRYEDLGGGPGWKSAFLLFGLHFFKRLPGIEFSFFDRLIKKYLNR